MRLVRTLLALEIDLDVAAGAWRRFIARAALALEALYRRPGLDERAVDREMVARQQRLDARLRKHGGQELPDDRAFEQTVANTTKASLNNYRVTLMVVG